MYAWTMPTEFNCQSAKRVKNAIVFYYIHVVLHTLAMSACNIVLSVFVMKCMLKFPYLNYLKSLISQLSKDLLARRNLRTAVSRASGLAAKWCWLIHNDKAQMQFSVLSVFCYGGILCTYGQLQLQHGHMQLLIYYYGNIASSIRRDLPRSLSFIIIGFGESKCSEIQSQRVQISKLFLGGDITLRPLSFDILHMQVCLVHYQNIYLL